MGDGALDFLPQVFVRLFFHRQQQSSGLRDGCQFLDQPLAPLAISQVRIVQQIFSGTNALGHVRLKLGALGLFMFCGLSLDRGHGWFRLGVQGSTSALSFVLRLSRSFMRALWS